MNELVRLFADIVLHRRGPADVPASGAMLGASLVAYLLAGVLALMPGSHDPSTIPAQLAIDLLIVVGLVGGLLVLTGRRHRLLQTLSALFGAGALLSALSAPFLWIAASAPDPAQPGPAVVLSSMALVVLLIASLMVTAHVVRSAMDWPYPAGLIAALVYFGVSIEVFRKLFPEAG